MGPTQPSDSYRGRFHPNILSALEFPICVQLFLFTQLHYQEVAVVVVADAVIDPRAVVVHFENALVARRAVVRAVRFIALTTFAPFNLLLNRLLNKHSLSAASGLDPLVSFKRTRRVEIIALLLLVEQSPVLYIQLRVLYELRVLDVLRVLRVEHVRLSPLELEYLDGVPR